MDHRLFFAVGDLFANILVGVFAGLISWAIVDTGWNMWLAMFAMMALGMIAGLIVFFAVSIKLGAMEVMVPVMFSGMLGGMVIGMAAAMMPPSTGETTQLAAILPMVPQLATSQPAAATPAPSTPPTIE